MKRLFLFLLLCSLSTFSNAENLTDQSFCNVIGEVTGQSNNDKFGLTVNATPKNSVIKIMNIRPKYKRGIQLKPGKYDVLVKRQGYKQWRKWVEITDADLKVDVILKKSTKKSKAAGPKCTQDSDWEYAVGNAYRVADKYATNRNPRSVFLALKKQYSFVKQSKNRYLLYITNKHQSHISKATLSPLFDVNKSTKDVDDEKPMWRVIRASFNGRSY